MSGGSAAFPRDPPAPPADCTLPAISLRPPPPPFLCSRPQSASRSRPHALTHLLTALKVLSQLRALWGRECPRRNSGGGGRHSSVHALTDPNCSASLGSEKSCLRGVSRNWLWKHCHLYWFPPSAVPKKQSLKETLPAAVLGSLGFVWRIPGLQSLSRHCEQLRKLLIIFLRVTLLTYMVS